MQQGIKSKMYFLKRSGMITGPFTVSRLNVMFHEGMLKCEDMCSVDKQSWHYIDLLFPELRPGQPTVVPGAAVPGDGSGNGPLPIITPAPICLSGMEVKEVGAAAVPADSEIQMTNKFAVWLLDLGRTIALMWNFQEIIQKNSRKSVRFHCMALGLNGLLGVGIVLLLGNNYSSHFSYFFSPLIGLALLTVVWGICCLTAWTAGKVCTPPGRNVAQTWQGCAAGLLMNYGTLSCSLMALLHGIRNHYWVLIFLIFLDTAVLSSTLSQLRDYMELNNKAWKGTAFAAVFALNPVMIALMYGFTKLI